MKERACLFKGLGALGLKDPEPTYQSIKLKLVVIIVGLDLSAQT
jgi:hypothetical protein